MAKRDSKWKRNLISIFIIVIMVLSVLGIILGRDEGQQTKKYRGYKFVLRDNKWHVSIGKKQVDFDYFPEDIEDIYVSQEIKSRIINTKMLYLTFDPENVTDTMDKFRFDLTNLLAEIYNVYAAGGTMQNSTEYILPVITCRNATSFVPVMEIGLASNTSISMEDNCIIAQAQSSGDIIKLRDAIIYKITGIIE